MKRLLILLSASVIQLTACAVIEGERIRAGELATMVPGFSELDPLADLGPAPAPSVRRVLLRSQLMRLASAAGFTLADLPESVCVERRQEPLRTDDLTQALHTALSGLFPGSEVKLELLDFFRHPVPAGTLRFQRNGVLGAAASGVDSPVLWRGSLTTKEGRSLPVWAKVRVLQSRECWIAKGEWPVGARLEPANFDAESRWLNPFLPVSACAEPSALGFLLRRNLRQGQMLLAADIGPLPAVRRGENIQAAVHVGATTLRFPALAENDGEMGKPVFLKRDGKRLRGKVSGPNEVVIEAGGGQ